MEEGQSKNTKKAFRINGFKQMDRFWELQENIPDIGPKERDLYHYLLHVNNKLCWSEFFGLSVSQVLTATKLSENTFYRALLVLEKHNFIKRRKGTRDKAAQISIIDLLTANFTVNQSESTANFTVNNDNSTPGLTANFTAGALTGLATFNNRVTEEVTKKEKSLFSVISTSGEIEEKKEETKEDQAKRVYFELTKDQQYLEHLKKYADDCMTNLEIQQYIRDFLRREIIGPEGIQPAVNYKQHIMNYVKADRKKYHRKDQPKRMKYKIGEM